jgi:D-sedoheptulose 7-phosphate isomerase
MLADTMQETVKVSTYLDILTKILLQIEVTSDLEEPLSIDEGTQKIIDQIISIKFSNKKVMIIGNGGSAAIASHIHNDLCKSVNMRAMVFYEPPLLTAFSNDLSYTVAFENLINLWADKGDMLIAISSSGQSENILRAAKAASVKGSTVITLSGFKNDNPLRYMGRVNFYVPSCEYGFVELIHSILAHYLSDAATTKCR